MRIRKIPHFFTTVIKRIYSLAAEQLIGQQYTELTHQIDIALIQEMNMKEIIKLNLTTLALNWVKFSGSGFAYLTYSDWVRCTFHPYAHHTQEYEEKYPGGKHH